LLKIKPTINQPSVYAFQYQHKQNKGSLVTLWSGEARPAEKYESKLTTIKVEGNFKNPVFVDLISGKVFEIPKEKFKKVGNQFIFSEMLVPDYPVLVAEKSILNF
jgi:hypothetical protein